MAVHSSLSTTADRRQQTKCQEQRKKEQQTWNFRMKTKENNTGHSKLTKEDKGTPGNEMSRGKVG